MPSYSILLFTFAMFSGLISGLSSAHGLDIRSDSTSQSNSEYLSANSNKTPLPSRYGKRGFFRPQQNRQGFKCDGTFYKQARVEYVAHRACLDEVILTYAKPTKNRLSPTYKLPRYDFPAPSLFPHEKDKMNMIRIDGRFFSRQNLRAFLKMKKLDYVVFAGACRTVGIVREISKGRFVKCTSVNGGNAEHTIVI